MDQPSKEICPEKSLNQEYFKGVSSTKGLITITYPEQGESKCDVFVERDCKVSAEWLSRVDKTYRESASTASGNSKSRGQAAVSGGSGIARWLHLQISLLANPVPM